jgi:hypothetical protein
VAATANELSVAIGRRVLVSAGNGLWFPCEVIDAKSSYGQERILVSPEAGEGKAWVSVEPNRVRAAA